MSASLTTTVRTQFNVSADATATEETLRDPLWYAAKYGAFDTGETGNAQASVDAWPGNPTATGPGANRNWDQSRNDGSACAGGNCADGEPDGYFLARRPELLEDRLRNLFEGLNKANNSAVAVSSSQLITGDFKYVANFNDAGKVRNGTVNAYALTNTAVFASKESWSAGDTLTRAANRQVITNGQLASSPLTQVGVPFSFAGINGLYKTDPAAAASDYVRAMIGGSATADLTMAQGLINYMRGSRDPAYEGKVYAERDGSNVMGTVVNSSPWLQDSTASARFTDAVFAGFPSYSGFVLSRLSANNVLWVGANDGMLHGFNGLTGAPILSYVPSPIVSKLASALSVSNTTAVPLVDGSPFVGDVLIEESPGQTTTTTSAAGEATTTSTAATYGWHSYLFSSLGRGGKAVFALDVTNPGGGNTSVPGSALNEANAGSIFKWMFSSADDADMGYALVDPVLHASSGQASPVAWMNNKRFAVLVPNGYGSANGRGALYILFVDGPGTSGWAGRYVKLQAGTDADSGYMGATWADLDNNGTADVIYVTDLKGKVWKFDVTDVNPANWSSAFKDANGAPVPFYEARSATGQVLPITTPPVVSFPSFGGAMVSFGTGKALLSGDFNRSVPTQRFYSLWDRGGYTYDQLSPPAVNADGTATQGRDLPSGTSHLLEILLARYENSNNASDPLNGTVYRYTLGENGTKVPVPTSRLAESFNPNARVFNAGWFFDFPSAGEQLIFSPVGRRSLIAFNTSRPKSDAQLNTSCTESPLGTFYAINPESGQAAPGLLPTVSPDGQNESAGYGKSGDDQRVSITTKGDETQAKCRAGCETPPAGECGPGKVMVLLPTRSPEGEYKQCVPLRNIRVQWREVPGMRTK